MENRNVTEKYREFAADYGAGMAPAQLCLKYAIPEDRFESFLRYLVRNGILDAHQPPPLATEQDTSSQPDMTAPPAAGEVANIGPKVLDVERNFVSRHPRLILCYVIALIITIALILTGITSLTGSLWKHRTEKKVMTSYDAKLYLDKRNPAKLYVDIIANGVSYTYEITRGWRNLPLDEPGHSIIRIEDQTKLKSGNLSLKSAHDVGYVIDRIKASKCYAESLNRPVKENMASGEKGVDPLWDSAVRRIATLPDCTYYGTANKVVLEFHDYQKVTRLGYLKKGLATIFTVHADMIFVPLSFGFLMYFFMFSSSIT